MVTNETTSQVQQKIDLIDQLRAEMDDVKAMSEGCKGRMDLMSLENKTVNAKLASAKN